MHGIDPHSLNAVLPKAAKTSGELSSNYLPRRISFKPTGHSVGGPANFHPRLAYLLHSVDSIYKGEL